MLNPRTVCRIAANKPRICVFFDRSAILTAWTPVEARMKSPIAIILSAALLASAAHAGGPVVVVEEPPPVVEEESASSKGILPWLVVPLFLCVVMCGEDED
jgi:hypothetical protein